MSPIFKPGLGKPLPWEDVIFVENYNERHRLSIVGVGTFRGDVSLATVQSLARHMFEEIMEGSERLRYLTLQQFRTTFLGFHFWKDDPTFHLDNHFSEVFTDQPGTPDYLKSHEGMLAELSGRAYPPQRSPWEVIVVRGFREEEEGELSTVLIARAHHSLMDATCMVGLLNKFLRGRSPVVRIPEANTSLLPNKFFRISEFLTLSMLTGFFSAFYNLQCRTIQNLRAKGIIASGRKKQGIVDKNKVNVQLTSKLPLSEVKELAAHLGVRVPSLLTTLIAENLAKVLPPGVSSLNATYVLPVSKHPGGLVNHAKLGMMELPFCRTQNIQSNSNSVNDIFLKLRFDPSILVLGYICFLVGNCPDWLVPILHSSLGYLPVTITNFSMGTQGFDIAGMGCLDIKCGIGVPDKIMGCAISCWGFKSHIQMFLAANDDFLSKHDLARIAAGIGEDFATLRRDNAIWVKSEGEIGM